MTRSSSCIFSRIASRSASRIANCTICALLPLLVSLDDLDLWTLGWAEIERTRRVYMCSQRFQGREGALLRKANGVVDLAVDLLLECVDLRLRDLVVQHRGRELLDGVEL